jgi:hypothetical protein
MIGGLLPKETGGVSNRFFPFAQEPTTSSAPKARIGKLEAQKDKISPPPSPSAFF